MRLALTLPGWPGQIQNNPINTGPTGNPNLIDPGVVGAAGQPIVTLGSVINQFLIVALYAGGFLTFFWAAWGVFDYIKAEGNKEVLAKARKRIQWALAGFVILVAAIFVSDYLKVILLSPFPTWNQPLQIITAP